MKILFAEDDIMMQKIVVHALIRLGYEVITVDDGHEALEVLGSEEFDLVILDLFMPRKSGFEVVETMREQMNISTPVLILSRSHLDDAIQKAYTAGANDFIVKPFSPEELVVKITRMLAPRRKE